MEQGNEPRGGLVLLTGSEGAIGRHVARALREHGFGVRGLDLRPAGPAEHEHVEADLLDLQAVRTAMIGVSAVVHAGGVPWDRGDGSLVLSTNVLGTWNVLQAAIEAGVERVVGFSSINAQGSTGGRRPIPYLPIDDSAPHHPTSPYQLSKHLMEEACRSFSETYGIKTICLRPVFVVHPASPHAAGIGTESFIESWRDEVWAYVDIRDVVDAVIGSLRLDDVLHDRFLLAARDTSVAEATRALVEREYADVDWPTVDVDRWCADDPHRSLVDCHRARDVLGWEARHSWRDSPTEARNQGS